MALFAIKTLPLNTSGMYSKVDKPMSTRAELGEFEIEAQSIEQARELVSSRVAHDKPHMICEFSEKTNRFMPSYPRQYVHPTTLYEYDGKRFIESVGNCHQDQPKSGKFLTQDAAKADYLVHEKVAQDKIEQALAHLKAMEALGVTIDYHMDGDTHGIYEDYLYVEVQEGPYTFKRILNS